MARAALLAIAMSLPIISIPPAATATREWDTIASGSWIGGLVLGDSALSLGLRLRALDPPRGRLLLRVAAAHGLPDSFGIRRIQLREGGALDLLAARGDTVLSLSGRVDGRWYRGAVKATAGRAGGASGTFAFARLAPDSLTGPGTFARWVGDYEIAPGRMLVIGRSLGQLFDLEPDGKQGAMFAIAADEYVAGPSHARSFPLASFRFVPGSAGRPDTVRWRDATGHEQQGVRTVSYDEDTLGFRNDAVRLAGSILMPRAAGPHAGVVLVHGSNAQSRYGQGGYYRFVADYLARHGIAVLCYDKRGTGGSGGNWDDPGLDGDALAALRVLRRRAGVDSAAVGLWGLSQGSWIVGQAAAAAPKEVAFVIPVGGGGTNGEVQEMARTEMQMRADGFSEPEIRQALELQRLKFRYARRRVGWDEYLAAVERARDKRWLDDPYIGPPTDRASPAWDFWGRDLREKRGFMGEPVYWSQVKCPVLVVMGALDTYSPPESPTMIDRYLQSGGNDRVTVRIVPNADHGIRIATTGGPLEDPPVTRFADGYLALLSGWIHQTTGH